MSSQVKSSWSNPRMKDTWWETCDPGAGIWDTRWQDEINHGVIMTALSGRTKKWIMRVGIWVWWWWRCQYLGQACGGSSNQRKQRAKCTNRMAGWKVNPLYLMNRPAPPGDHLPKYEKLFQHVSAYTKIALIERYHPLVSVPWLSESELNQNPNPNPRPLTSSDHNQNLVQTNSSFCIFDSNWPKLYQPVTVCLQMQHCHNSVQWFLTKGEG